MAAMKSVSNMSRRRLAAILNLYSASDCALYKSVPNSENCTLKARNFSHGLKCLQSMSSSKYKQPSAFNSGYPLHPEGLSHLEPWMLQAPRGNHINSSHQEKTSHEYICPSRLSQLFPRLVITDALSDIKSFYDCPVSKHFDAQKITPTSHSGKSEMLEPPQETEDRRQPSKEAKEIMRIRHKKMKRHKLKKLRKRMYFLWKKQKAARKAKRLAIYWKEIAAIKKEAQDFDAEAFVKEQLEKARMGGFYINIMDSKS